MRSTRRPAAGGSATHITTSSILEYEISYRFSPIRISKKYQAGAILRSKRRSPFTDEPTEGAALERRSGAARSVEREVGARDLLRALLARLEEELSPLGAQIFDLVWRQQKSTEQVCAELGMSKDAVHAWRSRIMKKARALRAELERGAEVGA